MPNYYDYTTHFRPPATSSIAGKMGLAKVATQDISSQIDFAQKILIAEIKNIVPGEEIKITESIRTVMDTFQVGQRARALELQEQQLGLLRGLLLTSMGGFIGHEIDSLEPAFFFDGKNEKKIGYELPLDAASAKLFIHDQNGILRSIDLDPLSKEFIWDGSLTNDVVAKEGIYGVSIQALTVDQKPISISPTIKTLITGIEINEEGIPTLMSDKIPIPQIKSSYRQFEKPLKNLVV